jgi:hypothetical protein
VAIVLVGLGVRRQDRRPGPANQSGGSAAVLLNVAIVFFAILTIVVALSGRVTIGRFSFAGADVPAVVMTVLLLVRFAPWLRARLESSRFSTEEWSAALWIVIGFAGSLGWNFFFHPFLFRVVTPFRATRVPARWAVIALVGIAVWAAIGAAALLARSNDKKKRRLLAVALIGLAIADVASRTEWTHVDAQPAPVYRWLEAAKPRAVIEVPLVAQDIPFLYLLAQTGHGVPLLNGTSGWETPAHERLKLLEEQLQYGDAFLAGIQPAELLIVHEARLTDAQRQALQPLLRRLRLVRRFETDAVYAVWSAAAKPPLWKAAALPPHSKIRIPRAPADSASAPRESLPR